LSIGVIALPETARQSRAAPAALDRFVASRLAMTLAFALRNTARA